LGERKNISGKLRIFEKNYNTLSEYSKNISQSIKTINQIITRGNNHINNLSRDINDIKNCLHEIRIALLEADVNYKVVKEFINSLHDKMQQEKISESLTPTQQIIKIVDGEITSTLGSKQNDISMNPAPPTIIMLVGLQGTIIISLFIFFKR